MNLSQFLVLYRCSSDYCPGAGKIDSHTCNVKTEPKTLLIQMKKKPLLLITVALCFNLAAYGQADSSFSIIKKLKLFSSNHITEKVYLQFDKPYYAAGDTIYFKAYLTKGERHQLSDTGGVLHVDLINANSKIYKSIELQADSGIAWGDFALPDSLPGGNYRIRAYTQWMRNDGEKDFFEKSIPVGAANNLSKAITPAKQTKLQADIQFLPEGGSLITGVRSKVAFKAIGADGLGIAIKGSVTDNDGKQVALFSSAHLGMGYFFLDPEPGKTYSAKVALPDSQQAVFNLPKAESSGINLAVDNDSISVALVTITANISYYNANKGKTYPLLIYSGGVATTVKCKLASPVIKLGILKRKLHTGVATITLFSPQNEPLCERLLFIQNYDQLCLEVKTNKTGYTKREKVSVDLKALTRKGDPSQGHFSVSVVDETLVPDDENGNNILTNLLLTTDLQGYVEQPGYYFEDTDTAARQNLDVLMLTQGYRRFTWREVIDSANKPPVFRPETGLAIAGQVTSLSNKPVANGTVTLIPAKGGPILSTKTDENGMFRFDNLLFADTTRFVLSAVNEKGKNSTKITYDNDKQVPVGSSNQPQYTQTTSDAAIPTLVENEKLQRDELLKYGNAKGIMLKEVKINAKEKPDYPSQSYVADFAADQVIQGKDILYGGPLSVRLASMLHRVHLKPGGLGWNLGGSLYVIVDGAPGNLDDVSTDRVATIEVLLPPNSYVYGQDGLGGVLIVTTKPGRLDPENMPSFGVLPFAPRGFYKAREFYAPKYDTPAALASPRRDLRSTIYWLPELKTGTDGKARFEYYNADGTGTYKIIIEGIDEGGNIGRQVVRYKVN